MLDTTFLKMLIHSLFIRPLKSENQPLLVLSVVWSFYVYAKLPSVPQSFEVLGLHSRSSSPADVIELKLKIST